MSLFRISSEGLIPFHPITGESMTQEQADDALAQALWSDLDAASGQRLFPVQRGEIGDDSQPPVMLALDANGGLVLLYARAAIGSIQLAECLEQLGWARNITIGELSSIYWRGADEFWEDWEDFSGTATPAALSEGAVQPRVVFVSTKVAASTESALQFLADSGVPFTILQAALYADDHGCQLLELRYAQQSEPTRSRNQSGLPRSRNEMSSKGGRNGSHPASLNQMAGKRTSPEDSAHDMGGKQNHFFDSLRRSLSQEGRQIDVGTMNRAAADELFSGSSQSATEQGLPDEQSRFVRPVIRKTANGQPQSCSVSPLRRKLSAAEESEGGRPLQSPPGRDSASLQHADRRGESDLIDSPQLAPLRFAGELVEPVLPAELVEPNGVAESVRGGSRA